MSSNRESQEFIIGPDEIKNLGVGKCVVSVKTAKVSRTVKLPLPKTFLSENRTAKNGNTGPITRGLLSVQESSQNLNYLPSLTGERFNIHPSKNNLVNTVGQEVPVLNSKWNTVIGQSKLSK
jgi:hypothetical protein